MDYLCTLKKKIMSILTRKYPFTQSSHWLRDCAVYCTVVFLIMYLLQPFGFSMYQGNKLLLFSAPWSIKWVQDKNPSLKLSEFGGAKF